jgi:2-polyprenyl-3-methyl-5-hydroxy-6-metoxy-1,4-benzoquinol methylase
MKKMIKSTQELLDVQKVTADGERVTHLWANDCYYAHLSLYHFALPFVQDRTVLDAGSGSGYGADYLARNGAKSVLGVDASEEAVAFSRKYFQRANLAYRVMDLGKLAGGLAPRYDVIFSSNVLEHVPDAFSFFRRAWSLLFPRGVLVLAVPPVIDEVSRKNNLDNPFHLNIWSPRQWHQVLDMFFSDIQCYRHRAKPGIQVDLFRDPAETMITEKDFDFERVSLDELYEPTLTVVFVARAPFPKAEMAAKSKTLTFVDDSFTRAPDQSPPPPGPGLFRRAWRVFRQKGIGYMIRRVISYRR